MIALGITLASIAVYLFVGWKLMQWDMPALWERARREHSIGRRGEYHDELFMEFAVSQVHSGAGMTLLLWPFRLPFLLAMQAASRHDPERIRAAMLEQQKRITELERELRIGRDR